MVISLHRCLIVLAILPMLALAACGGSDGAGADPDGIDGWRQQIRTTAAEQLPELARGLGAQTGPAEGRYQASGGGVSDRTFAYAVTATLTGGDASVDRVRKALEDLGYDVSATPVPNGTTSVTGKADGRAVSVTLPDDTARPLDLR
jgi:hypothetical protein